MENYYAWYIKNLNVCLEEVEITAQHNDTKCANEAMQLWVDQTNLVQAEKKQIFFIGNGASSMMAGHMSADAFKNGNLKSFCFNETALMTAVSNDIDYNQIFAFPLSKVAKKGDMLISISSSGNSPNIINGIYLAKDIGMYIVTLSGMTRDNYSNQNGHLNFFINSKIYGIIESAHQCILHCWLDKYIAKNGNS